MDESKNTPRPNSLAEAAEYVTFHMSADDVYRHIADGVAKEQLNNQESEKQ